MKSIKLAAFVALLASGKGLISGDKRPSDVIVGQYRSIISENFI